jgi:PhnB protein
MTRPRVAPYLTVTPAAAAIAFYTGAFDAKQRALMPAVDGLRIAHCELSINGGSVMLSDAFPELGATRPPMPGEHVTVSVSLEYDDAQNIDDVCSRAGKLGAKIETPPTNSFWGTRYACLRDPFGHRWILNAPLDKKKS